MKNCIRVIHGKAIVKHRRTRKLVSQMRSDISVFHDLDLMLNNHYLLNGWRLHHSPASPIPIIKVKPGKLWSMRETLKTTLGRNPNFQVLQEEDRVVVNNGICFVAFAEPPVVPDAFVATWDDKRRRKEA